MKRLRLIGAILLLIGTFVAQPGVSQTTTPTPPPAKSGSQVLTVTPGQKFILRLETAIHTHSTRKGDKVEFRTAGDVYVDNRVVLPDRSWVRATVTKAKRAGRLSGRAEVQLRFDEVKLADNTSLPLRATILRVGVTALDAKGGNPSIKGEAGTGGTIGAVATAGAQGALIGLVVAGAKGAMYGGAAAAAISVAGMVLKRGPDLDLPRDTMFEARFDQPLAIPMAAILRSEQARQAEQARQTDESRQTEQAAYERPASIESPGNPPTADEPISRTKPVLRRPQRDDQPPAETATAPPPAAEPTDQEAMPPKPENAPPAEIPPVRPVSVQKESPPVEQTGYKLSVSVKMVTVDAVVRDRAGRMIDNLTREDFRIFEDGVEQQVRSFSRDSLPLAVALVIDRSGSVAPYIDELRRIAERALGQLKPGDKVALYSFANTVERIEDLTTDRQRIASGIARIRAGGSTDIMDALFDATVYLARTAPEYRRAVILVSDNQPTVHPRASEGETIRMAMETETVVYSLRTSGEPTPFTLRLPTMMMGMGSVHKVAQETGGEVIDVESVARLDAALREVVSRLRLRYALGYYPSSQARGGAFHSIEVKLVERLGKPGSDYFMHARRGYYATGDQTASTATP